MLMGKGAIARSPAAMHDKQHSKTPAPDLKPHTQILAYGDRSLRFVSPTANAWRTHSPATQEKRRNPQRIPAQSDDRITATSTVYSPVT